MRPAVAWGVASAWMGETVSAVAVVAATDQPGDRLDWIDTFAVFAFVVGFGAVGLFLTLRRPALTIGWLMQAFALTFGLELALESAARWSYENGSTSLTPWTVLGRNVTLSVALAIMVTLIVTFPHGTVPSTRWRRLLTVVWIALAASLAFAPFTTYPYAMGDIEVVLPALRTSAIAETVYWFLSLPMFGVAVAAMVRIVTLLFRGTPTERHQIRWVAYVLAVTLLLLAVTPLVGGANIVAGAVAALGVPLSIGVAITRYRLYDIDRIVNRTAVYVIVVGVLAATFAAGLVVLTALSPFDDGPAVAASTLAVFLLFQPLRRRVQHAVDHRFNRNRYDAESVIGDLSRRLGDQVEPSQVGRAWLSASTDTMQPAIAGLWLKEHAGS